MKRSKFSGEQIAFLFRQAEEGTSVEDVYRKAGISVQTHYRWRKKYGGLMPSEMKRLVADLSLEFAQTHVLYGYRRIHVLLRREGWQVNVKRVYRLYAEEGLQLRNKTPKRKVSAKLREDHCTASAPNDMWGIDFMSDQLFDGRRIRILTIVDACIESLNGSFRAECLNASWFLSLEDARSRCEAWQKEFTMLSSDFRRICLSVIIFSVVVCLSSATVNAESKFTSRQKSMSGMADLVSVLSAWGSDKLFAKLIRHKLNKKHEMILDLLLVEPHKGVLVELEIYADKLSSSHRFVHKIYIIGSGVEPTDPIKEDLKNRLIPLTDGFKIRPAMRSAPAGKHLVRSASSRYLWYQLENTDNNSVKVQEFSIKYLSEKAFKEFESEQKTKEEFDNAGRPNTDFVKQARRTQKANSGGSSRRSAPISNMLRQVLQAQPLLNPSTESSLPPVILESNPPTESSLPPVTWGNICSNSCNERQYQVPVTCECVPGQNIEVPIHLH